MTTLLCHPDPEPFASCHSERSEESDTAQDKLRDRRISLRAGSVRGKGFRDRRVCKNVVRGFSLVHDPKGSHYENLGGEELPNLLGGCA